MAVAALTLSAAAFGVWQSHEGFTASPVIPTKGDVPTIGHGSTSYEDGTRVKISDPPITRKRAAELARNLARKDELAFAKSLPGVKLTQGEFDVYIDFVGQYGIGNWSKSSMRARLFESDYRGACRALLNYRFAAGYDCSTPGNTRCMGVWTRQKQRFERCMGEQ